MLENALNTDVISEYEISVPTAASVSSADRTSRTLNDVTFTATMAGAIHTVTIAGIVSL